MSIYAPYINEDTHLATDELVLDQEFDTMDDDVDFYAGHLIPHAGFIPQAGF